MPTPRARTLLTCLRDFKRAVQSWSDCSSFEHAETLCRESRDAWAAYLDEWLASSGANFASHRKTLDDLLSRSVTSLADYDPSDEGLSDAQRAKAPLFMNSISFRRTLLNTLHTKGAEAVYQAVRERGNAA